MKGFIVAAATFWLVSHCACSVAQSRIFMTSVQGNGDLSTWPDAHGSTGLQAADEICSTRAQAASIEDASEYIAWLSDANNDAYCRTHGFSGSRYGTLCGQAQLPEGAGPWYRMDGLPAMDILPNSTGWFDNPGYQPRHILFDEFGAAIPLAAANARTDLAFTGSETNGAYDGGVGVCSNWTSSIGDSTLGSAYYGFTGFSDIGADCATPRRLICLQRGNHGAALSRRAPATARRAFTTSSQGSGNLSTWAEAQGATGLAAGDAICRAHAAYAGLPLAQTYKAWLSTAAADARARFIFTGPWYRTDGVRVAGSMASLLSGVIEAPLQIDEFGQPMAFEGVWTGSTVTGSRTPLTCANWTSDSNEDGGKDGTIAAADGHWGSDPLGGIGCSESEHLYCFADNDSLFMEGFDP